MTSDTSGLLLSDGHFNDSAVQAYVFELLRLGASRRMRNRMMRVVVYFPVTLVVTALVLVVGCSESSVSPVDSPADGQSQGISIIDISSAGDVDVLHPRLVSGAGESSDENNVGAADVLSRPITNITFDLPFATEFAVLMYDVSGNEVFSVVEQGGAGQNQVPLDFSDKPSGIYVVTVLTSRYRATKKFRVVK